ncbi:MAG: M42 family metallopeptidase [bacterium]|nr:M42 family metallopeptidase [bacterium]
MDKKDKKFLSDYLNNASPTGFETSGQKIWLDFMKQYSDEYITDAYGSVAAIINPGKDFKVVIEAHADEISWFVKYISDDGYIYVTRNGGSDHMIAPSMRVKLLTEKGSVRGIFGWPAIHVRTSDKDIVPTMDNIFIDVGCSKKEEVEKLGIHVGTVAIFEDELMELNDKYYTGRALDNRIGGFMIAQVAKRIKENKDKLPFSLYVVNAVQEEIGLRGAEMISRKIKPDVAIITDVCHDTSSPLYDKKKQGDQKCGKGPVLTYGPAVQNNLLKMVIQTAEKYKIPFQRAAVSRSTGTDTDSFAYSGEGVPSALISLPLKYMHTTVETISKSDMNQVIDLMYRFVTNLKSGHDFKYIK